MIEMKNINSFRHAYEAIKYEEQRQVQLLESGGRVIHETRGWRTDGSRTVSQRSKEQADDYRYFPEPDLPPITVSREWVEEIRAGMPELPEAKRTRFRQQYGLSDYDTAVLTESRPRAEFFEATVALTPGDAGGQQAKVVANWMNGEVSRLLNANNLEIEDSQITPQSLSEIIELQEDGTISGKTAKDVFEEMFRTGRAAAEIVREAGLTQITAADEIADAVDRVLDDFPKAVEDHRRGKEEAIKFLVGQVMRETKGRARPDIVHQLLREKLRVGP